MRAVTEIWERQPGEPDDAWAAYLRFCARRLHTSTETDDLLAAPEENTAEWAQQYGWDSRAAAFDAELIRRRALAAAEEISLAGSGLVSLAASGAWILEAQAASSEDAITPAQITETVTALQAGLTLMDGALALARDASPDGPDGNPPAKSPVLVGGPDPSAESDPANGDGTAPAAQPTPTDPANGNEPEPAAEHDTDPANGNEPEPAAEFDPDPGDDDDTAPAERPAPTEPQPPPTGPEPAAEFDPDPGDDDDDDTAPAERPAPTEPQAPPTGPEPAAEHDTDPANGNEDDPGPDTDPVAEHDTDPANGNEDDAPRPAAPLVSVTTHDLDPASGDEDDPGPDPAAEHDTTGVAADVDSPAQPRTRRRATAPTITERCGKRGGAADHRKRGERLCDLCVAYKNRDSEESPAAVIYPAY